MAILALDLGLRCGWAVNVLERVGGEYLGGTWDLRARVQDSRSMYLVKFRRQLELLGEAASIEHIVYEGVTFAVTTHAAHLWGAMQGQLMLWADEHEIPYEAVQVPRLKKWATGKGNAGKGAMIAACCERCGTNPADDNEADARLLLAYALENCAAKATDRGDGG